MQFIADLHVHSHYSRATSKDMSPEGIWKWAQLKGITVIATGDFTHPDGSRSWKEESAGNGLFTLKNSNRRCPRIVHSRRLVPALRRDQLHLQQEREDPEDPFHHPCAGLCGCGTSEYHPVEDREPPFRRQADPRA
jgi:hypothetical protein